MKKFKYILCALTLLVASATAHAQVFDVTITPSDGSVVFTKTSATSIEIKPGDESPIHVFSGDSDTEGESLTVAHGVRYDFALTPVTTINSGSGNLPEGNFPAQAPRRKAAEDPSFTEPTLTGPALVIMREDKDPIIYYAEDATEGKIKLKCNPNGDYMVENTVVDKVIAVFYKDAHTFQVVEDDNGNATWTWAEDYSTATLNVACTCIGCSVNDNQTVTPTSEVTTAPTLETTGVRTYTAKATYNEVEYEGTTTEEIPAVPASMTLDDTTDPTSMLQVLVAAGVTQDITLTGRTLYKDGYYNTLCLPFEIEDIYADDCPLKGCTLKEVQGASLNTETGVMTITLLDSDEFHAGVPYLIKWEAASENIVSPTFTGVTITTATPSTISGDNLDVIGTFAPKTMKASDTDLFFLGAENQFYTSNSETGANLKGYRCYFRVKTPSDAPERITIGFEEDETAGIDTIEAEDTSATAPVVYDLSGRRTTTGRKGLQIVNGKKVYNQ